MRNYTFVCVIGLNCKHNKKEIKFISNRQSWKYVPRIPENNMVTKMRLTLAHRSVRNPRERVTNRKLAMSAIIRTRHVSLEFCVLVIAPLVVHNFVRYERTRGQRGENYSTNY